MDTAIHRVPSECYSACTTCIYFAPRTQRSADLVNSRVQLDKALLTAQLRSPNRDDGTIARILWKKSAVLRSEPTGLYQKEASDLLIRAEMARGLLNTSGEGRTFTSIERDDDFVIVGDEEENSYDALVPGFFR